MITENGQSGYFKNRKTSYIKSQEKAIMKRMFISLLCVTICGVAAHAQTNNSPGSAIIASAPDPDAGKFEFKEDSHNFGEVPEGPLAECDFIFKNTGKKPILITEAHGTCGCTVPEWPHQPIKPGDAGLIHIKYTTMGRKGEIMKDVIITSNAQQSPMILHIRGWVKPKPKEI